MARIYRRGSPLVAAVLALSTTLAPVAQRVPSSMAAAAPAAMAARVNSYLDSQVRAHLFSGTVLVASGDKVLLDKGYGMADWAKQIHNTASTVFIMPNLLGEFATAAILQLEDAEKLHENDHICTYVPRCTAGWSSITLHQVLTGTAGLRDYINNPTQASIVGHALTLAQVVSYLEGEPLDRRPGTACCDFNGPTPIEEYLVERVTGVPFAAYVRQHFLGPLGLTHTGYYLHLPPIGQRAAGYQQWQVPAPSPIKDYDMSAFGGEIYTTVADTYRWEQALHSGCLLSATSTARIVMPSYVFPSARAVLPGLALASASEGWETLVFQGRSIVYRESQLPAIGMLTTDAYNPKARITFIVLSNVGAAIPSTFWERLDAKIFAI